MDKLLQLIWGILLSPEKQLEKKKNLVTKRLRNLINGGTGGGFIALTFWEKVKIAVILLFLITISMLFYLVIIIAAAQK